MKTVKISPELHKELKKIAVEHEKELGFIIEMALAEWVKKVKSEEFSFADNLKQNNQTQVR
jgi:predicted transcriptional regulator